MALETAKLGQVQPQKPSSPGRLRSRRPGQCCCQGLRPDLPRRAPGRFNQGRPDGGCGDDQPQEPLGTDQLRSQRPGSPRGPRPEPNLPRRAKMRFIQGRRADETTDERRRRAVSGGRDDGETARETLRTRSCAVACGFHWRRPRGGQVHRGPAKRNEHCGCDDLTTCFSSEDVWRGPCASTDRDRRLRLLQALVMHAPARSSVGGVLPRIGHPPDYALPFAHLH